MIALAHLKWIMHFGWVKGQAGIEGNDLVDRLARGAAVEDGPVVYDKMPREVIVRGEKENGLHTYVATAVDEYGEVGSDHSCFSRQ